jgi:hypothetical protein
LQINRVRRCWKLKQTEVRGANIHPRKIKGSEGRRDQSAAAVINRPALSVHQFMAKSEPSGEKSVAEWTCVAREHFIPRSSHARAAISTIVNARFISSQSTWSVDLG